jgi:hypothetical protein
MIGQYLPNNNETATVAFRQKFCQLNSPLVCDANSPPRTKPPTRAAPAASNGKGFLNLRPVKFLFFKKKNLAFFFW